MKLKQKLEDFKVEEINQFVIKKKGPFKLFLLEKRGLETFSLLVYLSNENKVPFYKIGFAGLKDRHAISKQYITIPQEYEIKTLHEKNFDITFLGYVTKGLKLGDLEGNKFKIVVRGIKREKFDDIFEKIESIKEVGIPNYYDSQRFGSVIAQKFIAKFVIKKNYEEAVKIYLTRYTKHENKIIKEEKKLLYKNWNKVKTLPIKTKHLKLIIDAYVKTGSWLEAYKIIPFSLREMYFSAYQSYLWNECVKEILKVNKCDKIKYEVGEFLFYKEKLDLPQNFPAINEKGRYNSFERSIINKILKIEDVKLNEFDVGEIGKFRSFNRPLILKPSNLKRNDFEVDKLNKKSYKLTLDFVLQKGSYATLLMKRIFK